MKTKLALSLIFAVASANAATISFSNFDSGSFAGLVIVDSSNNSLGLTSTAEVGFFSDEALASVGDFTTWNSFGSVANFGAGFDIPGLYSGDASASTAGASAFIGQSITTLITNSAGTEYLVAKSDQTFGQDNPLFTATVNIFSDSNISYLFGGSAGSSVDFGTGPQSSIQTAAVPEPSAYALLGGLLALGCVMLRRRA
jgi:hypothetical protein